MRTKTNNRFLLEVYDLLASFFMETLMIIMYAWVLLLLWNAISVDVFSLPKIDYGQAVVLTILDRLLLLHIPKQYNLKD